MDATTVNADQANIELYKARDDPDQAVLNLLSSDKSSPTAPNPISSLPQHLLDMESLISLNECNTLVDQQLKLDATKNIPTNYINPFQDLNSLIDEFSTSSYTPAKITPQIHVILRKDQTKSELVQYFHGCLLWPVKDTLERAIKAGFLFKMCSIRLAADM